MQEYNTETTGNRLKISFKHMNGCTKIRIDASNNQAEYLFHLGIVSFLLICDCREDYDVDGTEWTKVSLKNIKFEVKVLFWMI